MAKLIGQSKLTSGVSKDTSIKGIISKKTAAKVKSFRLSDEDIQTLSLIRGKVDQCCKGNITESKIIKALIIMGSKVSEEKIVKILADNL